MTTPNPIWIFHSGLPALLGPEATSVLRALMDFEAIGAGVSGKGLEVSIHDLARVTGICPDRCLDSVRRLQDLKCLAVFIPDNYKEPCLIQLRTEMPCPQTWNWIEEHSPWGKALATLGGASASSRQYREREPEPDEVSMRDCVDAYFNNVSMSANSLTADTIAGMVRSFGAWKVRKTFEECGRLNKVQPTPMPRGMRWCQTELQKWSAREEEKARKAEEERKALEREREARERENDTDLPFAGYEEAWQ